MSVYVISGEVLKCSMESLVYPDPATPEVQIRNTFECKIVIIFLPIV